MVSLHRDLFFAWSMVALLVCPLARAAKTAPNPYAPGNPLPCACSDVDPRSYFTKVAQEHVRLPFLYQEMRFAPKSLCFAPATIDHTFTAGRRPIQLPGASSVWPMLHAIYFWNARGAGWRWGMGCAWHASPLEVLHVLRKQIGTWSMSPCMQVIARSVAVGATAVRA